MHVILSQAWNRKYRVNCTNSPTPFQPTPPSGFSQKRLFFHNQLFQIFFSWFTCSILSPVKLLTYNRCGKIKLLDSFPLTHIKLAVCKNSQNSHNKSSSILVLESYLSAILFWTARFGNYRNFWAVLCLGLILFFNDLYEAEKELWPQKTWEREWKQMKGSEREWKKRTRWRVKTEVEETWEESNRKRNREEKLWRKEENDKSSQ